MTTAPAAAGANGQWRQHLQLQVPMDDGGGNGNSNCRTMLPQPLRGEDEGGEGRRARQDGRGEREGGAHKVSPRFSSFLNYLTTLTGARHTAKGDIPSHVVPISMRRGGDTPSMLCHSHFRGDRDTPLCVIENGKDMRWGGTCPSPFCWSPIDATRRECVLPPRCVLLIFTRRGGAPPCRHFPPDKKGRLSHSSHFDATSPLIVS